MSNTELEAVESEIRSLTRRDMLKGSLATTHRVSDGRLYRHHPGDTEHPPVV